MLAIVAAISQDRVRTITKSIVFLVIIFNAVSVKVINAVTMTLARIVLRICIIFKN